MLKSNYQKSEGQKGSDGSACSPMAHGRMAGTCGMGFLIRQAFDETITT